MTYALLDPLQMCLNLLFVSHAKSVYIVIKDHLNAFLVLSTDNLLSSTDHARLRKSYRSPEVISTYGSTTVS